MEKRKKQGFVDTKKLCLILFSVFLITINLNFSLGLIPSGANVTSISNSTANPGMPQSVPAIAGNVSEINIFGYSSTQSWQGYFGNISGVVRLSDSSDNVLYNWSLISPKGEIYATTNNSIVWTNIQCFNYTAKGSYEDDSEQKGGTSLFGMNLSTLETSYNISTEDVDGVNETFNLNNHQMFYTNQMKFDSGECKNSKLYNSTGDGVFDEVLLYSPDSRAVVFTSIILDNTFGFDTKTHDFEMMVLENGHETDTLTTPYYFYVELE